MHIIYKTRIKITADVGNARHCYVLIPGTSLKSLCGLLEVLLENIVNFPSDIFLHYFNRVRA
jgi:hypothetical protein